MALNRAVHFCGVSDIKEPYPEWKAFKQQMSHKGSRNWNYGFRRLWYVFSEDITASKFWPWLELANRGRTCSFIVPGDLWIDAAGTAHVVWSEQAIKTRLRERFFSNARQRSQLNYAVVSNGQLRFRYTWMDTDEGIKGFSAEHRITQGFTLPPTAGCLFAIMWM